jgi:hypothetical protein
MFSRKLIISLALLLFLFLIVVVILFLQPTNQIITEKGFEGVIFRRENAPDVLRYMLVSEKTEDEYWTPTKNDILGMEEQLVRYVAEQMPALQLADFKRQYFGFYREGKQLIMVVGFCAPVSKDWVQEVVSSSDVAAGCYFETQYDDMDQQFLYLWQSSQ